MFPGKCIPFAAALLCAAGLVALSAHAESTAPGIDPGKRIAVMGNSRGATGCVACHGTDGAGMAEAGYPRLAGLPVAYMVRQLQAFRSGERQSALMERIAQALDGEETQAVTAYFAGLPVPDTSAPLDDPALRAVGARLVDLGKWSDGVPACVRCHGRDAQGVPPVFPRLAGQHASYLEKELHRWREGERRSDPAGIMAEVARGLDEDEIAAVAAYLASLPPGEPTAAGPERAERAEFSPVDGDEGGLLASLLREDTFSQPDESRIPDEEFGKKVLLGKRVFVQTQEYAKDYVGNSLACVNCHLDRGRRVESAPMGAAYIKYPKYRSKNKKVNTMIERIQGCFRYSQNGTPPPPLSDEMKGLLSYFYFLSKGLPSGKSLDAAGFPKIAEPPQKPDPTRGAAVFAKNCSLCHGANGEGLQIDGRYQFPPLWGPGSFNWGAGMHRVNTAAAFVRGNMPLGNPAALDLQQAWDVAAYINSHERPQDPRYEGDVSTTEKQYHDHQCYYGETLRAQELGTRAPG